MELYGQIGKLLNDRYARLPALWGPAKEPKRARIEDACAPQQRALNGTVHHEPLNLSTSEFKHTTLAAVNAFVCLGRSFQEFSEPKTITILRFHFKDIEIAHRYFVAGLQSQFLRRRLFTHSFKKLDGRTGLE
ncbi:Hypothetical_protein [Hexamita inflata]|uniref:Hypothetical_protein n=1 Tax=Hexamita inflata TaxID=28002 RepID=A0AA86NJX0_9EUKA|nr:Hypothetical protein HINF_LOCUS9042 [Hexamita inflata]